MIARKTAFLHGLPGGVAKTLGSLSDLVSAVLDELVSSVVLWEFAVKEMHESRKSRLNFSESQLLRVRNCPFWPFFFFASQVSRQQVSRMRQQLRHLKALSREGQLSAEDQSGRLALLSREI